MHGALVGKTDPHFCTALYRYVERARRSSRRACAGGGGTGGPLLGPPREGRRYPAWDARHTKCRKTRSVSSQQGLHRPRENICTHHCLYQSVPQRTKVYQV